MTKLKKVRNLCIGCHENDHKPSLLLPGGVAFILIVVLILLVFALGSKVVLDKGYLSANVSSSYLVDLANIERDNQDLSQLKVNPLLEEAAKLKADDMAQKGYFSHTTPEGYTPWHFFEIVGYDFLYAGENLAVDFEESEDVSDAWMESPSHRYNVLNENFTEVGIATSYGIYKGEETTFVVQMFGTPKSESTDSDSFIQEEIGQQSISLIGEEDNKDISEEEVTAAPIPTAISLDETLPNLSTDILEFINGEKNENVLGQAVKAAGEGDFSLLLALLLSADEIARGVIYFFIALVALSTLSSAYRSVKKGDFGHILYGVVLILVLFTALYYLNTFDQGAISNIQV